MTEPLNPDLLEHTADLISQADALIVASGASHALVEIDRVMRAG
jgi:glutamyl-tRNA reductase